MPRALFIGHAPSRDVLPARPFSGRSGRQLAALCDLDDLVDAFDVCNLLDAYPLGRGTGRAWPHERARVAAERLAPRLADRRVVLVGDDVARAFSLDSLCYYPLCFREVLVRSATHLHFAWAALLPHPSGVNLWWWNDPRNVARARRFLLDLRAAGGSDDE